MTAMMPTTQDLADLYSALPDGVRGAITCAVVLAEDAAAEGARFWLSAGYCPESSRQVYANRAERFRLLAEFMGSDGPIAAAERCEAVAALPTTRTVSEEPA